MGEGKTVVGVNGTASIGNVGKGYGLIIYDGILLVLDNFREVLRGYSVDVQDVVRSAILDGVNIGPFIKMCKDDPYKLDQLRLAVKEGFDVDGLKKVSSGNLIYQIRQMKPMGLNVVGLESQLAKGTLSEEHLKYTMEWIKKGYNIHTLNISLIPRDCLKVFGIGLERGLDMRKFNNGVAYKPEYLGKLLNILSYEKPVEDFLDGDWELEVLSAHLVGFAKVSNRYWNALMKNIDKNTPAERVGLLIKLIKAGIDVGTLQKKGNGGKYVYSEECLQRVLYANSLGLDYKKIIANTTDPNQMDVQIREMQFNRSKRVKGKL